MPTAVSPSASSRRVTGTIGWSRAANASRDGEVSPSRTGDLLLDDGGDQPGGVAAQQGGDRGVQGRLGGGGGGHAPDRPTRAPPAGSRVGGRPPGGAVEPRPGGGAPRQPQGDRRRR